VSGTAIACIGLACSDHIWHVEHFPPQRSRTPAPSYRSEGGGPAATGAVAATRLGVGARLISLFGDDDDGRAHRRELERYGVDLAGSRVPRGARSFVSAVLVDPHGERVIFPYRGEGLVDDPTLHDWGALDGVGAVMIDGRHPRLAHHALDLLAGHGVVSIGDWGDLREPALRARIDVLAVSEEAAAMMRNDHGFPQPPSSDPHQRIADALRALPLLRALPEQRVAVTVGELGCVWLDGRAAWHQRAPTVEVIDSNGAGDVFHGALTAALAERMSLVDALRLATATAALRCAGVGRAAIPHRVAAAALADTLPAATPHTIPAPGGTL
jgi:sulfofructose kinase